MRRPSVLLPALLAACVLAVAGCGGDDEADVREVVEAYVGGLAEGDGERVCEQLTEDALEQVEERTNGRSCPEAIEQTTRQAPQVSRGLRGASVRDVKIEEERAVATVDTRGDGPQLEIPLRRVDGEWRVTAAGG